MVFCGKPSKGCEACRAKKKKCDGRTPACSLCVRTGIKCPGYRDQQKLAFRDENERIVAMVRNSSRKDRVRVGERTPRSQGSSPRSETPPPRQLNVLAHQENTYGYSISHYLSLPIEDQAIYFFYNNYIFVDMDIPYDLFTCVPAICGQIRDTKALSSLIACIGTAGLSNLHKDHYLMRRSREIYCFTLRYTQNLLEDSSRIREDQTLLMVLLLALYEDITCCVPQSMQSWSGHVRGATALLLLRGQDSLYNTAGIGLFLYLRQQIVTDCLQRAISVPQVIIDWSHKIKNVVSGWRSFENVLLEISMRLCELRSAIREGNVRGNEVIRQAVAIDKELECWRSSLPVEFSYSKVDDFQNPETVFFGYYHVYSEKKFIPVWNYYRSLRILTNEILLDGYRSNGTIPSAKTQQLVAEVLLNRLTSDICGSVLPLLGNTNGQKYVPVLYGTFIIWPLYVCATNNYVLPKTREWIITQFNKIGEVMGIQLATTLADILKTSKEVTVWKFQRQEGGNEDLGE